MKNLIEFILCAAWVAGIVIAQGFWSVFFAFICPLWAYYLLVEALLVKYRIV